jgi:hypothetical protein
VSGEWWGLSLELKMVEFSACEEGHCVVVSQPLEKLHFLSCPSSSEELLYIREKEGMDEWQ